MTDSATPIRTNRWHRPTRRGFGGLAIIAVALSTLATMPAGAQSGCGTYSFSFEGTRLLNDGISNSAGPFAADLPPGTYTVTLTAHDQHSTLPDVQDQQAEQYRVVLDSGYVSPPSKDIPDDADTTTTVFTGQVIGQSNAISVTHIGLPGINSVNPLCVGFTPEASPVPEEAPVDPIDEPEVIEVEVKGIVEELPAVEDPAIADREPAGPDTPPQEPVAVTDPPAEFVEPPPVQDIGEPVVLTPNNTDTDDAEVPTVQVAGITLVQDAPITQEPLLAITGPSTTSFALTGFALLLLAVGGFLLRQERRLG